MTRVAIEVKAQGGGYTGWVRTEQAVAVAITAVHSTAEGARADAQRRLSEPDFVERFNRAWGPRYSLAAGPQEPEPPLVEGARSKVKP